MAKQAGIIVPEGCKKVLVHACCAPCSSAIVEWMMAHGIEPVIYYYNPNIFPKEEYEIRKNESKRHAETLGIKWFDDDIIVNQRESKKLVQRESCEKSDQRFLENNPIGWEQRHEEWKEAVCGLENEPERGKRCEACFYHRMLATGLKAKELGIQYFATTLASSRWKNLEQINAAGIKAQETVNRQNSGHRTQSTECSIQPENEVIFWAQNWRKDGLQDRRNALLKEYNFYNQQYCGCEYSMRTTEKENANMSVA